MGLNGLGSPFGFETASAATARVATVMRLNGLGSPFGFETGTPRTDYFVLLCG